jgi:hypothetical protein
MPSRSFIGASILTFLAIAVSAVACAQSTTGGGENCAEICQTVAPCGAKTCLAECIGVQTACTVENATGAFSDWSTCVPAIVCVDGQYGVTNCPVAMVEISTECHVTSPVPVAPGSVSTNPGDAGHDGPTGVVTKDGGIGTDGNVSGPDSSCGFCESDCTNSCGSCTGGDCQTSSEDSGCGFCQADCENGCGACTGGDCQSSEDAGFDAGSCGECQSDCVNGCDEECSGGLCESGGFDAGFDSGF